MSRSFLVYNINKGLCFKVISFQLLHIISRHCDRGYGSSRNIKKKRLKGTETGGSGVTWVTCFSSMAQTRRSQDKVWTPHSGSHSCFWNKVMVLFLSTNFTSDLKSTRFHRFSIYCRTFNFTVRLHYLPNN